MDEPGHHFSGVKRPPGCRETGAPTKTPIFFPQKSVPIINKHHAAPSTPRDNTDTLIASSWAVGRRPGHRFPDAKRCPGCQCPPRSRPSGRYGAFTHRNNGRRVAGGRPPEADLKRPAGQPYRGTPPAATSLYWGQPRVSRRRSRDEFGLGPATRCHHGARTPTQTNIFLHGVRRARPLLSARRRVPALPVSVRAAIPARRAHHPDHLEEEPAAGPSLTRRRARGKLLSSTQ